MTVNMNGNDIVEMESMTEEMEGDTDADIIEEDVGETSLPFEEEQLYKSMKRWIVFCLTVKLKRAAPPHGVVFCL